MVKFEDIPVAEVTKFEDIPVAAPTGKLSFEDIPVQGEEESLLSKVGSGAWKGVKRGVSTLPPVRAATAGLEGLGRGVEAGQGAFAGSARRGGGEKGTVTGGMLEGLLRGLKGDQITGEEMTRSIGLDPEENIRIREEQLASMPAPLRAIREAQFKPVEFLGGSKDPVSAALELGVDPFIAAGPIGKGITGLSLARKGAAAERGALKTAAELFAGKKPVAPKQTIADLLKGEAIPTPEVDPVKKIMGALTRAEKKLPEQQALYSVERAKRFKKFEKAGEGLPGEAAFEAKVGTLKGKLPQAEFKGIREEVGQADMDQLFGVINNSELTAGEKATAGNGLKKLLGADGVNLPNNSEINALRKVYPEEFIATVLKKRPMMTRLWEGTENVLNLPRAIMATADLSAPLRQGIFLTARNPVRSAEAFKEMFKYAFKQSAYDDLLKTIKAHPNYQMMKDSKLALTDIKGDLLQREEMFMSNLAEKIPGFGRIAKGSNRAYSGFLNKMRADVFNDLVGKAKAAGKLNDKELKGISSFVNSATGRGDIKHLKDAIPIMNGLFFSPRLMASRFNLLNPIYYTKLPSVARKAALESLGAFAAAGTTLLTLASLAGAEVETDTRSSDFAKIKVGNTRYDILGGFQQYMVLASRMWNGDMVSSTTGKVIKFGEGYKPMNRLDLLQRFFEYKTSPVSSFALGLAKGKSAFGDDFNAPAEVVNRFIPMVAQDMYDLYKERGPTGLLMGVPAIFGTGAQTYGDQVPTIGETASGKETVKWRQPPTPGEDLVNFVTGKKVSEIPEAEQSILYKTKHAKQLRDISLANLDKKADELYSSLSKMPPKQANMQALQIKQQNPDLYKKLEKRIKTANLDWDYNDTFISTLGVKNGDKAKHVVDLLSTLKTNEEKNAFIAEKRRKKVISNEVYNQIVRLVR